MNELYTVRGKTILREVANYPTDGTCIHESKLNVTGYASFEIPEDKADRNRLFNTGNVTGCRRIERTKEEYEAQ